MVPDALGTPAYMAPECFANYSVRGRKPVPPQPAHSESYKDQLSKLRFVLVAVCPSQNANATELFKFKCRMPNTECQTPNACETRNARFEMPNAECKFKGQCQFQFQITVDCLCYGAIAAVPTHSGRSISTPLDASSGRCLRGSKFG